MESTELMHYGVLGMKWGVRKDRSTIREAMNKASASGENARKAAISELNRDTKKHTLREYNNAARTAMISARKKSIADSKSKGDEDKAVKEQRKQMSAARRHLSDGDLKKAIERLQQEKKLKDLTKEDVSHGKTVATNILSQIGKSTITTVGTAVATYAVKAAMEQHFDIKDAAKFIRPKK